MRGRALSVALIWENQLSIIDAMRAWERLTTFLRWRPTSVILIILIVLYAVTVPLNVWSGRLFAQRGDYRMSQFMYSGAFWNGIVTILLSVGWWLMKRQTRKGLLAGACALAAALLLVARAWFANLLKGLNPFPATDIILFWLPMLYAIAYALHRSKRGSG